MIFLILSFLNVVVYSTNILSHNLTCFVLPVQTISTLFLTLFLLLQSTRGVCIVLKCRVWFFNVVSLLAHQWICCVWPVCLLRHFGGKFTYTTTVREPVHSCHGSCHAGLQGLLTDAPMGQNQTFYLPVQDLNLNEPFPTADFS